MRFSDVAQPHITRVLKASSQVGDFASTYLFCGTGGTGKTTLARVVSMAVLCDYRTEDGEPCGLCSSCRMIRDNTHRDVVEINCGTNGKAEETRALISDEMTLAPIYGKKRIYILDEAHNTTSAAQDSLLKVLEEPPSHVMFFLCTTELDKIKPTIRTRCQIHRFKKVSDKAIRIILKKVVQEEMIEADEGALDLIIQDAQGSARQALSTLEQVKLIGATEDNVRNVLGRAPRQMAVELLLAITQGSAGFNDIFRLVDTAQEEGHDLIGLLEESCRILSNVARERINKTPEEKVPELIRPLIQKYTGSILIETVNSIFEIISKIRQNVSPELAVQFGLMTTIQRFANAKAKLTSKEAK